MFEPFTETLAHQDSKILILDVFHSVALFNQPTSKQSVFAGALQKGSCHVISAA